MTGPGVSFAIVLNAVVLGAIVLLTGWLLRSTGRSSDPDDLEGWYGRTGDLAAEVERAIDGLGPAPDRERVSRELLPMASRLEGHFRTAPAGVTDDVVRQLYDLSIECRRVGLERAHVAAVTRGAFLEDHLDGIERSARTLRRTAVAERSSPEGIVGEDRAADEDEDE